MDRLYRNTIRKATDLKAWISYHSLPLSNGVEADNLSLYWRFNSTWVSLKFGKGMPTQMTARALLSVKSSPSLTLPRHTANITAPLGDSPVFLLGHSSDVSPEPFNEQLRALIKNQNSFIQRWVWIIGKNNKTNRKLLIGRGLLFAVFDSRVKILERILKITWISRLANDGFVIAKVLPSTCVSPSSDELLQ